MKDQSSVDDRETTYVKWDRARSLFLESLYKPDNELRSCAHNQKCYNELMEIKDRMIDIVKNTPNPKLKEN